MRPAIYCVVPPELSGKVHEPLCRFYRNEPAVSVIVEQRHRERRSPRERRSGDPVVAPEIDERRRIISDEGRRAGDRRAPAVAVEPLAVPRKLEPLREQLLFVERIQPPEEYSEDLETDRIIARAQGGDEAAFTELYLRYFDRIYGYLRVALGDVFEAEDAAQQVFMKVLEALPRYEIRRDQPFRAWVFRIARNRALNHREKHCLTVVEDPERINRRNGSAQQEVDLDALGWLSDGDLLLFIERLPLIQRQVLTLSYMMGLSTEEIAGVVDRSPEAVRQLQHRALRFLETRLTSLGRKARRTGGEEMLRLFKQAWVLRSRRFALDRPLRPLSR